MFAGAPVAVAAEPQPRPYSGPYRLRYSASSARASSICRSRNSRAFSAMRSSNSSLYLPSPFRRRVLGVTLYSFRT